MQYGLTEEQQVLRKSIRDLARGVIAPRAEETDEKGEFPADVWGALAKYGWLSLAMPEQYGGMGESCLTICIVIEEIARVCASSSQILSAHFSGSTPIVFSGSPEQKSRYLPDMAVGEKTAALALTEPETGADVSALTTAAVPQGDHYRLNGAKCFVSNGEVAEVYSLFAVTDPGKGTQGVSVFILEKSLPGFTIGKMLRKMGTRGSPVAHITLEECLIPRESLLGEEGDGYDIAVRTLDRARIQAGAQAVGIAQEALDSASSYAKERVQFSLPLAAFPAIRFKLAEMAMRTEAARQLVYSAAAMVDEGSRQAPKHVAMAKCFASDTAVWVAGEAMQIMGGYGYMKEYHVERLVRDAKVTQISGDSAELRRLMVAQDVQA